jgi:hypothetical protein
MAHTSTFPGGHVEDLRRPHETASLLSIACYSGTGFVNVNRATVELSAVQCGDSFVAFLGVRHFDEAEAP